MDLFLKTMKDETSECPFDAQDMQRCPFLRNITKPASLCFSLNLPNPFPGARGPIFEDGPSFDMAFKHFHGSNGLVPLGNRSNCCSDDLVQSDSAPKFNPLAANAATISLSAFPPGGPFGFNSFLGKWKKYQQKKSKPSDKKGRSSSQARSHEAMGNEWLQTGNCPIAKSYRAVSGVVPLVAKALQPPPGMKFKCPPAIVAARAALAKTTLAKNLRPQPLSAKMLAIASLGMAVNVPLGIWREHTEKFSPSWFVAVHAAVPFIAMLRKAILMPKAAMALTIGASILGQALGARAERVRMKALLGKREAAVVGEVMRNDIVNHANNWCNMDNVHVTSQMKGASEKQVPAAVEETRSNLVKNDINHSLTSQMRAAGDRQVASLVERIFNDLAKHDSCGQEGNVASQCAKEQVTWYNTHSLKEDGSGSSRASICF